MKITLLAIQIRHPHEKEVQLWNAVFHSLTGITWLTSTMVVIDQIDAGRPILTLADAVVDVLIAVFTHPSHPALA